MNFKLLSKLVLEKTKWSAASFSRSITFSFYFSGEVCIFSALVEKLSYPLLTISNSTVSSLPHFCDFHYFSTSIHLCHLFFFFFSFLRSSVNTPLPLLSILLCIHTNFSTISHLFNLFNVKLLDTVIN